MWVDAIVDQAGRARHRFAIAVVSAVEPSLFYFVNDG